MTPAASVSLQATLKRLGSGMLQVGVSMDIKGDNSSPSQGWKGKRTLQIAFFMIGGAVTAMVWSGVSLGDLLAAIHRWLGGR